MGETDLAKLENTWTCMPHIVSLGAQKNFAEFAKHIGKRWGSEGASFDELWFKRMIAKAIIFRATEKLVSGAEWYEGGYRANIVTYAIAKLVHDAEESLCDFLGVEVPDEPYPETNPRAEFFAAVKSGTEEPVG